MQANIDIRKAAADNGVHLYEIAFRYGCNDGNFSRKLRRELPAPEKQKILQIIAEIAEERQQSAAESEH